MIMEYFSAVLNFTPFPLKHNQHLSYIWWEVQNRKYKDICSRQDNPSPPHSYPTRGPCSQHLFPKPPFFVIQIFYPTTRTVNFKGNLKARAFLKGDAYYLLTLTELVINSTAAICWKAKAVTVSAKMSWTGTGLFSEEDAEWLMAVCLCSSLLMAWLMNAFAGRKQSSTWIIWSTTFQAMCWFQLVLWHTWALSR